MNILKKTFFACGLSLLCASALAQELNLEATVTVSSSGSDYHTWKTKRMEMQLQREHNTIISCSLKQPAAVLGSAFFSALAVMYTVIMFSGNGNRDDAKDFVKTIELLIHAVKEPFTLQHEKNKARDRIARMHEQVAARGLTI